MKLNDEHKLAVLLNRLDFHAHELQRSEEKETQLFEWSTALLLAVFAATLVLADPTKQQPNPQLTKLAAIFLVTVPTAIFVWRVLGERKTMVRQAEVIQRIEERLHLFDENYFFSGPSLYPDRWRGNFARSRRERKTPLYYSAVMIFMLIVVITTIWIVL